MTDATVTPLARFPLFTSMGFPVLLANQPVALGAQPEYLTFLPHPDGQGDVTWQGGEFGLTAPDGANVTNVAVTVTYRVSSVTAYPEITAQLYANSSPVGSPASFTPVQTQAPVTGIITVRTGISAAHLSTLAVQVTFHSAQAGLGYVYHAYATADYSFADAVGTITVAGNAAIAAPVVSVHPPGMYLRSAGTLAQTLSPAFGAITIPDDLLLGWTFSNSSSGTFETTCSNPAWQLLGHAGGAFGWRGLWCKPLCGSHEAAPVFSSSGASEVMSQLLEFTGCKLIPDQAGTNTTAGSNFSVSASASDTASGDFIAGILTWAGSNLTPVLAGVSGADSSGAALPLNTISNGTTTGELPYVFAWGQATPPAGPGADSITASLPVFDAGSGIIASFVADRFPPPPAYAAAMSSG